MDSARWLLLAIFLPLAGACVLPLVAPFGRRPVRMVALVTTLATLLVVLLIVSRYPDTEPPGGFAVTDVNWLGGMSNIDIRFHVGLDGISLWLFALSALLMVTSVLVSWEAIQDRPALFYGMLLLLELGCLGVFAARDIILFYVFFEFTLIPLFFLIGIWGSEERRYAAAKFFIYTLAGSLLTFLALIAIVFLGDYRVGAAGAWANQTDGRLSFSIPHLTSVLPRQHNIVFDQLDTDRDQRLDIVEVLRGKAGARRDRARRAFQREAFDKLDVDHDAALDARELGASESAAGLLQEYDRDSDGRMERGEFYRLDTRAMSQIAGAEITLREFRAIDFSIYLLIFAALFAGFAIKVPLFPLHTWLPLAHVQAPTAGSVILAGVLLKIGTYGFVRFSIPMLPEASAACMPWLLWLSVIGIVYGALVALAQQDMKRLIAYSSVSHMGFCMLGLFALNRLGTQGAVLQMVNHGISTGALFAIVGMIYERYHTRQISELGGIARRLPLLAFFMVLFTFSSIGVPGLNGFAGEILLLVGMFQRGFAEAPPLLSAQFRVIAVLAVTGVVLGAWYMLWLVQRIFFGPLREPPSSSQRPPADLSLREALALAPLAVLVFWIGLAPGFFLRPVAPTLDRATRAAQRPLEELYESQRPLARQERPAAPLDGSERLTRAD